MDIDKIWKELKTSSLDNDQINKEMITQAIQQDSHSAIAALKKHLKSKINYVIGFILLFLIMTAYYFNNSQMVMLISIVNIIYILAYFMLRQEYKKMEAFDRASMPLLQHMKGQLKLIKDTLNKEMLLFMITLPFILLAAALYHDVLKGFSIIEAFNAGDNLRGFAIYTLVFTPLIYFFGTWMNKVSFGIEIKRLEKSIEELESLN